MYQLICIVFFKISKGINMIDRTLEINRRIFMFKESISIVESVIIYHRKTLPFLFYTHILSTAERCVNIT